jgi:hypothetical protein
MRILGANTGNAFGEAPPDDRFRQWWTEHKKGEPIPEGYVLPVNHALQGHPEAPRLWEKHIVKILDELLFKLTTHIKCIYQNTINGKKVLFAVACRSSPLTSFKKLEPS